MIVLTATLILIIAAVVARAGVVPSSGSIHSPGGHFALSGHRLSGPSAGKLFVYGIVVRIAGLLGFSILPGAPTCAPGLPRIAAGPDGIPARDQGALCLDRDRLAGEPIQRSASRHRQAWARCRTLLRPKQASSSCPARRRRRPLAGIQILAEPPFAGVLQRVSRPVITMASRTRGVITHDSAGTDVPAVARNRVAGSVNAGRRNRNAPR